jgi:hypothetical protein
LPDDLSVVLYSGIGDHVMWLGLLGHVRPKCRVVVTVAPAMEGLARLFPDAYDELRVEGIGEIELAQLRYGPTLGRVLGWHGCWRGDELAWLQKHMPDGTVADVIRDVLGCPGAALAAPRWEDQYLPDELPPGRTVLLAPSAHTAAVRLNEQWWIDAAAHLEQRGFTVLTNVANRGRGYDRSRFAPTLDPVPGTIPVDVPLEQIGPFAERCGFVLCSRAGLADILARVDVKMTVIWPTDEALAEYHDRHFAAWSVRRIYGGSTAAREVRVDRWAGFDVAVLTDWF